MSDLQAISVEDWYVVCQDCERWSNFCAIVVDEVAQCREGNTYLCCQQSIPRKEFFLYLWKTLKRQENLTRHRHFCDVYSLS